MLFLLPCHKLSHLLGPPPPSSVTYFMDGPTGLSCTLLRSSLNASLFPSSHMSLSVTSSRIVLSDHFILSPSPYLMSSSKVPSYLSIIFRSINEVSSCTV